MIEVACEWRSYHEITPPDGMSEDEFRQKLDDNNEDAWQHALDQTDSRICELTNWEVTK